MSFLHPESETNKHSEFFFSEAETQTEVVTPETVKDVPLFTSQEALKDLQGIISDSYQRLEDAFEKLGDGTLHDGLTLQERNEAVDEIVKVSNMLDTAIPKISAIVRTNARSIKGLKIRSFVNPNAFEGLLGDSDTTRKIKTSDTDFQELHR